MCGRRLEADNPGGNAHCRGRWRNVLEHNGAGGNTATVADSHITQYFGSGADNDAITHLGMAIAAGFSCSSQRHRMQQGDVVAHRRRFTDDNRVSMVEHDAFAQLGGRMDIDTEEF